MILESINLENFRCFYGNSSIEFSTDEEKNVTLISAENGLGKTSILNALLWCFYNQTTKKFEQKDRIVNDQATEEGVKKASVEVYFIHNEEEYVAKRHFISVNPKLSNDLKVSKIENGQEVPHPTPDAFINSVIPKDMAGHFLFDGEHAEAISGEENRELVGAAVRDILGCTLVVEAINDLDVAYKNFRKLANEAASSSDQLLKLQDEEKNLNTQIEETSKIIIKLEKDDAGLSKQMSDIRKHLHESGKVKEIQKRRENLERHLKAEEERKLKHRADVFKWLGDNGRYLVAKKLTNETFACLEDESTKGKIPAPYDNDFVSGLLSSEICCCGRPLPKGSEEATSVASMLETASSKALIDRVIKVRTTLEVLKREKNLAPERLVNANADLAKSDQEIVRLEAQIKECSDLIKGVNVSELTEKEEKYQNLDSEKKRVNRAIGDQQASLSRATSQVKAVMRQIDTMVSNDDEGKRYTAQRDLAFKLKERLEVLLQDEEKVTRGVLRKFISDIIEVTAKKDFKVKLDEHYAVTLTDENGLPKPKSEGENQLLGLTFTAALCKLAAVRKGASRGFLLPGTEAPLVLDSPFVKLDHNHEESTAKFIPEMAAQVVLMVSAKQGSENVMAQLKDRIGMAYCLVLHNRASQGKKKKRTVQVAGEDVDTVIFDSEFDGTEIKLVNSYV